MSDSNGYQTERENHEGRFDAISLRLDNITNTSRCRGGLEMLFSDKRHHELSLPAKTEADGPITIAWLIEYLCQHKMEDPRSELFVLDQHL